MGSEMCIRDRPARLARAARAAEALWNFTRPHTLIGSAMSIPALHLFAAPAGVPLPWSALGRSIAFVLAPSLLINVRRGAARGARRGAAWAHHAPSAPDAPC